MPDSGAKPPPLPVGGAPTLPQSVRDALDRLSGTLDDRLRVLHEEVALTRSSLPPPPPDAPPPTLARKTVQLTGKATTYVGYALIVVLAASQAAAQFKPGLVGPLGALAEFLKALIQ
jgi:hypothetical protein